MIPFIKSIPNIVPKLLRHIDTSAIMDLLLKIISMEKTEPGSGIVEAHNLIIIFF
jgi:SIT4-associating protein SAP185/190